MSGTPPPSPSLFNKSVDLSLDDLDQDAHILSFSNEENNGITGLMSYLI
jgi:hypothetical protein